MSYIPKGCDQQGRYPEAAEAATEIGLPNEPEHDMMSVIKQDVLLAAAAIAVIAVIALLALGTL